MMGKLSPYLKISKNCGTSAGCFPVGGYRYIDNSATEDPDAANFRAKVQLADGSLLSVFIRTSDCSRESGPTPALKSVCGDVEVDVNGLKGPNVFGKDFFRFYITKYGIIPKGTAPDTDILFSNDCVGNSGYGEGCAAWVIYNENMDYTKCSTLSWNGPKTCP